MWIIFILFICFLLALGYFVSGNAVAFTVKSLVALGAIVFIVIVGAIIWALNNSSHPSSTTTSTYTPTYQTNTQTMPAQTGTESSGSLPTVVGQCDRTTITQIGTRLTDGTTGNPIPGTGSAIWYADGGYQVSYDTISGITNSKVGDSVNLCLIAVPNDCPKGDNRGIVYQATNLRTNETWQAQNSEHSCGGA